MCPLTASYNPSIATPLYAWALDQAGLPVHISQATRGGQYVCPLCGGRMIPRLGDHKQHHFGHDLAQQCPPEAVARMAARRWLALELERLRKEQLGVIVRWPCPLCSGTHSANLLHEIHAVREIADSADAALDIALIDGNGVIRWGILLSKPATGTLRALTARGLAVLVIDVVRRGPDLADLTTLLAGARISGGVCATQREAIAQRVITEPAALRNALIAAVANPPHRFAATLQTQGGLTHLLALDAHKLWVPPPLWERAIGGLHHTIPPALQVISQEWPQPDGATIALYYITVRETCAVAVRRFPPGETVYTRIAPEVLHSPQLTALTVARSFAEV